MSERSKQTNKKSTFPLKCPLKDTICHTHKSHMCTENTEKQDIFRPFLHQCVYTHTPPILPFLSHTNTLHHIACTSSQAGKATKPNVPLTCFALCNNVNLTA